MATTNYTPDRFTVHAVYEILLRDPSTKKINGYLDDCKTTGLEKSSTLVFPEGGRGSAYIGGAFGHSNRAKLNVTKASWNTSILALQNGTEVVTGSNTNAVKYDMLKVATDKTTTTFKALGTVGNEIGFINVIDATNGKVLKTLTQGTTASTGKFAYAPTTKEISFFAGEVVDNSVVALSYNFDSGTSAQTITVDTDKFPSTQLVTAFGLVKDTCTGELYQAEINGIAQIDPNWKWDLNASGEPAVQDFNLEFVKGCASKMLFEIIVFNEADAK